MTTFAPQAVRTVAPDPFKHVNYTLGMVLGVDDFTQEFSYLAGRDQWLARDLLGYGTVCGLRVTAENAGSDGWQIVVGAGTAVNPRGEFLRVPAPQCARLNRWLDAHREEVRQHVGSPPEAARLYVVLCYRDCAVDLVPIPGEPCRSEDDSMAPSRLQDDYLLELKWAPPDQRHEDAIRDFVAWMSQIELTDLPDSAANRSDFERAVRNAVPQLQSPPTSPPVSPPDYMLGSPPEALRIPREAASEYLRRAFLIWTTELRPLWLGINQDCAGTPPDERCVLLAEVNIPLTSDGQVSDVELVTVEERRRPYLLSLRMIQEWMLRRLEDAPEPLASPPDGGGPITLAGDAQGPGGSTTVVGLHGAPIVAPVAADSGGVLTFNGANWSVTKPSPGPVTLVGDAQGPSTATSVTALLGQKIASRGTAPDQVLRFDGAQWQPVLLPTPPTVRQFIAAGRFDRDGKPLFSFNKLVARRIDFGPITLYFLNFSGLRLDRKYIVKGTVVNTVRGTARTIEFVDLINDPSLNEVRPLVDDFNAANPGEEIDIDNNLVVRVSPIVDDRLPGIMLEISDFTE